MTGCLILNYRAVQQPHAGRPLRFALRQVSLQSQRNASHRVGFKATALAAADAERWAHMVKQLKEYTKREEKVNNV
jgi:hypothetical protein